jgi:hypothetical protein
MKTISAWDGEAELLSPDGLHMAKYSGSEVGMGGPTIGFTKIVSVAHEKDKPAYQLEDVSASMIWSPDSKYLIVARWSVAGTEQEVVVVNVSESTILTTYPGYGILEFTGIQDNVLRGVVSPAFEPKEFSLELSGL